MVALDLEPARLPRLCDWLARVSARSSFARSEAVRPDRVDMDDRVRRRHRRLWSRRAGARDPPRSAGLARRRLREAARRLPAATRRPLRPRGGPHPPGRRPRGRAARLTRAGRHVRVAERCRRDAPASSGVRGPGVSGWPEANMFPQPDLERALGSAGVHAAVRHGAPRGRGRRPPGRERRGRARRGHAEGRAARSPPGSSSAATAPTASSAAPWRSPSPTSVSSSTGSSSTCCRTSAARWTPINWQLCDPARPTTLVSADPAAGDGSSCASRARASPTSTSEATAWRLLAPWGVTPDTATLERHAVYTFQARWVDSWRQGRLLLAGDAAHQMPPFAGQGMCAGLRDAANLAWKLDLVLRGPRPRALLDTYASERTRPGAPGDRVLDRARQGDLRARPRGGRRARRSDDRGREGARSDAADADAEHRSRAPRRG